MSYAAPLQDMLFVMRELANLEQISQLPGYAEATPDTVQAVLEEQGRFCSEMLDSLNAAGDRQPSTFHAGQVRMSPGFPEAYKTYAAAGWQGVQHGVEYGGQGLPRLVAAACMEMLNSANLSFALCPLLTDGAIEALMTAGSEEQKQAFLPNLVSGRWTGTMNLTEPQAGSDLALVRTRAERQPDGSYKLSGTKIFITYGEHDMAENVIHFVLARAPDAPPGVKGISLFIVPKFLVNPNGSLGARNDVACVSIEHKLGIKASPTAVMQYGEHGGATGYLVGEENRGLEIMFIMMNAARYAVGMQGVALAERAYQKAVQYSKERVQSRDLAGSSGPVTIIHHPDVRRLLMMMRARTQAGRALAYVTAAARDVALRHGDPSVREQNQRFYEYMVPIIKGWCTEVAVEVASDAVQVHGGMGFIEETGAAQYYRDARILPIYEGTTAIQANDLVGRKTLRDGGATAKAVLQQVRRTAQDLSAGTYSDLAPIGMRLSVGADALEQVVDFVLARAKADIKGVYAGSVPYLKLAGVVLAGWQLGRAALSAAGAIRAGQGDQQFLEAKIATARFYADHILPQAEAHRTAITEGSVAVLALPEQQF